MPERGRPSSADRSGVDPAIERGEAPPVLPVLVSPVSLVVIPGGQSIVAFLARFRN